MWWLGTYFKISLSLTMRLISATSASLTHTKRSARNWNRKTVKHTLFSNEGIVAVVGVVCITCRCAPTISKDTKVEFCSKVSLWTGEFIQAILT